jgi:hypothetical protein
MMGIGFFLDFTMTKNGRFNPQDMMHRSSKLCHLLKLSGSRSIPCKASWMASSACGTSWDTRCGSAWGGSSVPHTYCPLYSNVINQIKKKPSIWGWFVPSIYANFFRMVSCWGLPPYCILFVFDSSVHFMLAGFKTPPTSSFPKAGLRDPPVTFGTEVT